jgi:hypothetical protein
MHWPRKYYRCGKNGQCQQQKRCQPGTQDEMQKANMAAGLLPFMDKACGTLNVSARTVQ